MVAAGSEAASQARSSEALRLAGIVSRACREQPSEPAERGTSVTT
jgi:hypothetical protein